LTIGASSCSGLLRQSCGHKLLLIQMIAISSTFMKNNQKESQVISVAKKPGENKYYRASHKSGPNSNSELLNEVKSALSDGLKDGWMRSPTNLSTNHRILIALS
jgi:hypothetical protein